MATFGESIGTGTGLQIKIHFFTLKIYFFKFCSTYHNISACLQEKNVLPTSKAQTSWYQILPSQAEGTRGQFLKGGYEEEAPALDT
jgi:hypothetical protein